MGMVMGIGSGGLCMHTQAVLMGHPKRYWLECPKSCPINDSWHDHVGGYRFYKRSVFFRVGGYVPCNGIRCIASWEGLVRIEVPHGIWGGFWVSGEPGLALKIVTEAARALPRPVTEGGFPLVLAFYAGVRRAPVRGVVPSRGLALGAPDRELEVLSLPLQGTDHTVTDQVPGRPGMPIQPDFPGHRFFTPQNELSGVQPPTYGEFVQDYSTQNPGSIIQRQLSLIQDSEQDDQGIEFVFWWSKWGGVPHLGGIGTRSIVSSLLILFRPRRLYTTYSDNGAANWVPDLSYGRCQIFPTTTWGKI